MSLSLQSLLDALPADLDVEVWGGRLPSITKVSADSRLLRPGSLFVAIRGEVEDGFDYVDEALDRGAVAIVGEDRLRLQALAQAGAPCCIGVRSARRALAYLAEAFYAPQTTQRPRLLVTLAEDASETWARLAAQLGAKLGLRTAVLRGMRLEFHTGDGVSTYYRGRSVPQALDYAACEALCAQAGIDLLCLPVERPQLQYERVTALRPDLAWLRAPLASDPLVHAFLAKTPVLVTASPDEEVCRQGEGLRLTALRPWASGHMTEVHADGCDPFCQLRPGRQSALESLGLMALYPALAASFALPPLTSDIIKSLSLAGDREWLPATQAKAVLLDGAWRPEALERLIEDLRPYCPQGGQLRLLFGTAGGRAPALHEAQGYACRQADALYFTLSQPREIQDDAGLSHLIRGLSKAGLKPQFVSSDREACLQALLADSGPQDLLIIAGNGDEPYRIARDHLRLRSDKEAYLSLIAHP